MEPELVELVAYHEAGHAVMGVALGGRIVHASIEPPDDDGPLRYGESILQWPAADSNGLAMAEIKVSLAGPVAEMIYSGNSVKIACVPEFANDWHRAFESAALLRSPLTAQIRLLSQIEDSVRTFLEKDHHWAAVAAAADELLAHETIEHECLDEIVAFWIGKS